MFVVLRGLIIFVLLPTQIDRLKRSRSRPVIFLLACLLASLMGCFFAIEILGFYIYFELSALLVFFLVIGLGYQPERLVARMYLLMFTIMSSMPFFAYRVIRISHTCFAQFEFLYSSNNLLLNYYSNGFFVLVSLGFLVKFPIYFFHVWLPKAHVEASARGSIILAGVLLKLGVYGFYRISMLINGGLARMVYFFRLLGGGIISVLCLRAHDLKILIAYSSVAHIRFLIGAIISNSFLGCTGALGIRIAHGFASRGLFFGAGIFYAFTNSRLLLFNSGQLTWAPWFTLIWCLLCFRNIGTPPRFNFWSEVVLLFSLARFFSLRLILTSIPLFVRVAFRLLLFLLTQRQKESIGRLSVTIATKKDMIISYFHILFLLFVLVFFVLIFK